MYSYLAISCKRRKYLGRECWKLVRISWRQKMIFVFNFIHCTSKGRFKTLFSLSPDDVISHTLHQGYSNR
ncbi:hypothetical protein MKX01_029107, partial [Papaver californicum]